MLSKRRGLTMTEVVVVIVLVMVVFGVATVFLQRAHPIRDDGAHFMTGLNLKQMSWAVQSYHDVYRKFPPAWGSGEDAQKREGNIHFHLLPFLEHDELFKAYSPSATVTPFLAPLDPTDVDGGGVQNFAANLRVFSRLGQEATYFNDIAFGDRQNPATWDKGEGAGTFKSIKDGNSNTILFATRFANNDADGVVKDAPNCSAHAGRPYHENGAFFGSIAARVAATRNTQLKPTFQLAPSGGTVDCSYSAFAHSYKNWVSVSLADGSSRGVSASISPETWNRAMQPNDGLPMGDEWND